MLDQVDAALSLWDRFKKWRDSRNNPPSESVATRFVRLFESHGVHRNQIPRFIGHGLTLKDVQDDAALFAKLDESLLEAVCVKFAVRREWLEGAEELIHPCHDFYKYPEKFLGFIEHLMDENPDADLQGVVVIPEVADGREEVLLILQETIGTVGERPIYRFHLCNNWSWTYWKARAYLTACVAIAWKREVFISGTNLPQKEIMRLFDGRSLMGWSGEGIWSLGHRTWYPEDMALAPHTYLDGVDPERDGSGIKSGLKLWLSLEEQGYMDTGMQTSLYPNPKLSFQQALSKCS